ncbi:MAG: hypothetical protein R3Y32_00405 [Bacillota bacterium]
MKVIKFLARIVATIVVVVMILALVLVGVSAVTTPSTFGIENLEINGVSLADQGLADTTFYNIGKIAIGLLVVEEEESVSDETYAQVAEKLPTISSAETDSTESGNDVTFDNLLSGKIYFEEEAEVVVDSSEISAIMNMVLGGDALSSFADLSLFSATDVAGITWLSSVDNSLDVKINLADLEEEFEMSMTELVETLQQYDCEFISISPTADDSYIYFETKFKLVLPDDMVTEINSMAGFALVSENVYITYNSVYRLEDGNLVVVKAADNTMVLNSLDKANSEQVATSIFSVIAGESVDGEEVLLDYNNNLSSLLATVLNNIGEIQGVEDGELIFVTYTE